MSFDFPNSLSCFVMVNFSYCKAASSVSRNANDDDLKKSYRRLAMKWYPVKNPLTKKAAEAKFKQISQAYDVLSDPQRHAYDQHGEIKPRWKKGTKTTFLEKEPNSPGSGPFENRRPQSPLRCLVPVTAYFRTEEWSQKSSWWNADGAEELLIMFNNKAASQSSVHILNNNGCQGQNIS
ncbi:hypothetical protein F2Q68_00013165 [Brassica cretica]|uniref:J domain-containing protein n=1 Tax=Brassica cretica TaxID=69181 RepID=A0A8S9HI89_BRACR|nr:hypothetical protein F2Q68_00013165 [Brassica cretica]